MVLSFKPRFWLLVAGLFCACAGGNDGDLTVPRAELLKPETCKGCHPKHYEQWASSMHAYASQDPIFLAMNQRGQREAGLGPFCVRCHAPMALHEHATADGSNLDAVPSQLQGVTCYFCHNAIGVDGDHNNGIRLADDKTMRAGIEDPGPPGVHSAAYSELLDHRKLESSSLCGSCHDVVTPNHGVRLERTFEEYRASVFAQPGAATESCLGCHMEPWALNTVIANAEGAKPGRNLHGHLWPGVDVALSSFPNRDVLRAAIEECELSQSIRLFDFQPDPAGGGRFNLTLATAAGHNMPSGAAQDRRMWLELTAYDRMGNVIDQSGTIADDGQEMNSATDDIALQAFRDQIFDADGNEVHMFWDAAPSAAHPSGFDSRTLPRPRSLVVAADVQTLALQLRAAIPSRVELRLRVRPVGVDVMRDLVDSGDLDVAVLKEMPTFTALSAVVTWSDDATSPAQFTLAQTQPVDCNRYRCMLDATLEPVPTGLR